MKKVITLVVILIAFVANAIADNHIVFQNPSVRFENNGGIMTYNGQDIKYYWADGGLYDQNINNDFYWHAKAVGGIKLINASNAEVDELDLTVINNNQYPVKFKGEGSIIVTVEGKQPFYGSIYYGYYVITVPYTGNHVWDFLSGVNPREDIEWGSDWKSKPSSGAQNNRHPIKVATPNETARDGNNSIYGTNAFYIPETAGLLFDVKSGDFGHNDATTKLVTFGGGEYDQYYTPRFMIPQVKGGSYIKIWWDAMSEGHLGAKLSVSNVYDLEGKKVDTPFIITGVTEYGKLKGNTIFKVEGDATNRYDVVVSLNPVYHDGKWQTGWNDLYKIEITDTYSTDMVLFQCQDTGDGWATGGPVTYNNEYGSIVHKKGEVAERYYNGTAAKSILHRGFTCDFEAVGENGVTFNQEVLTVGNGHHYLHLTNIDGTGNIKITQKERFSGDNNTSYVLSEKETWLAVGEYTEQSYPYTWDFMDWNMKQKRMLTVLDETNRHGYAYGYWNTASNNVRSLETHEPVDATKGNNNFVWNNMKVDRPLFAQGSQLSYRVYDEMGGIDDIEAFKEAEGLRMKQFWGDELGVGSSYDGEISLDGDFLKFNPTVDGHKLVITIPNVPTKKNNEDMWLFVKSSVAPQSVYAATDKANPVSINASVPDKCRLQDDVKAYKITSAGDVEILFTESTSISAIGVTHIFKNINVLGYATESRDVDIDHEYEGVFTQNDVNAFCIQTYNNDGFTYEYKGVPEVRMSGRVHTVPKNTGIILYVEKADNYDFGKEFKVPLFYPACNNKNVDTDELVRFRNNWLAPWVTEDAHVSETVNRLDALRKNGDNGIEYGTNNDECTKFVMSRQHYVYNKATGTDSELITDLVDDIEVEAFYRMRLNSGVSGTSNTMGANKAYLLIPTSKMPKALWDNGNGEGTPGQAKEGVIFMDLEKLFGEEIPNIPTDIVSFDSNESLKDNSNIYHTLSGMQIEGKPTAKGVYIKNGKKVFIK